ncbi:MAG: tetratricopeptide repeat protein [Bdellovibrionales bacterium]|nr:tetratricopeptide repeat protein [Bdellovibrionales bacterium]
MKPIVPILTLLALVALFQGCSSLELNEAQESLREGKYYIAVEHYMSFAKNHPKHRRAPEALLEVGNIQHSVLGEPDKAILTYEKLVSSYPVNTYTLSAQRKIAEIHKNHFSNYHEAIIEYEKFLHAAPDHEETPAIIMELAHCYTLIHDFKQAEIEYDRLIRDYPKFNRLAEVYFQKGNNDFISGRYEKSIKNYQNVVEHFKDSDLRPQAIFGMANAYEEMDDFKKAKEFYHKILNTYPSPNVVKIRLKGVEDRERRKNSGAALKPWSEESKAARDLWRG